LIKGLKGNKLKTTARKISGNHEANDNGEKHAHKFNPEAPRDMKAYDNIKTSLLQSIMKIGSQGVTKNHGNKGVHKFPTYIT
jgi:hypothetical protein